VLDLFATGMYNWTACRPRSVLLADAPAGMIVVPAGASANNTLLAQREKCVIS